jgi:glucose/arabinose dehydrogenase
MTPTSPYRSPALAAALALLLAGCGAAQPPAQEATPVTAPGAQPAVAPAGTPTAVTTGLAAPWSVAFVGDTALISERDSGNILELTGDTTRLAGTVPDVRHVGESGLLGLAVDEQQRLYAYSTGPDGNRIQRFALSGAPGSFALGAPETILEGLPAASYHDGGRLAFGPDGMLYATVGDAGQRTSAQDLASLGGKILRMTPDGDVPADNPFPGSLVYSYGHRNPQGIAWDSTGRMFAAEFGQNTWDELNIVVPGGNFGWPQVEGIAGDDRYIDPVQQWSPAEASPSGVTIVHDTIFIANLRGQVLRAVPTADPATAVDHYPGEFGRIRAVMPSPDGDLWFLTSNTDGRGDAGDADDRLLSVGLAN